MPAARANSAHSCAFANALTKQLACARQATDKVENALMKEYFTTTDLEAVLDPDPKCLQGTSDSIAESIQRGHLGGQGQV